MGVYSSSWASRFRMLIPLSLSVCGACLSPAAIRPTAKDNAENVVNLGSNAVVIGGALRNEVAFHGELRVHQARRSVFAALTALSQKGLPSKAAATDTILSNNQKPWYTWFDAEVQKVAAKLSAATNGGRSNLVATLAERNPVMLDAALSDHAFSYLRIFWDAVDLEDVNKKIDAEGDPDVRNALLVARNRISDPYLAVAQSREQTDAYLAAVDQFLGVVAGQANLARDHASVFLEFAGAKPTLRSVQGLVGNEQLRGSVLSLVEAREGSEFADRLRSSLEKFDQVSEALAGLGGT